MRPRTVSEMATKCVTRLAVLRSHRLVQLAEHEALEGEVRMSAARLKGLLKRVRDLGYWQGESQQASGVTDISVPLLDPRGDAFAVLTCPFIRRIDRHVGAGLDRVRDLLVGTAKELSLAA